MHIDEGGWVAQQLFKRTQPLSYQQKVGASAPTCCRGQVAGCSRCNLIFNYHSPAQTRTANDDKPSH